nr:hypothetical protein [Tanacetum cinerariifolium]
MLQPPPKKTVDGVEQTYPPTTTEEKLARKNELKARGTLLMALSIEHQLKLNSYKNAKSLMEAIKKWFRGNKESKKVQKTLLKQQYEKFNRNSSEGLDQIYNRLQKLISQLEIHGETISQKNINLKFIKSLPPEWKTHTLIWRNKPDLETLSMDELHNNQKSITTQAHSSNSANTDSLNFTVYRYNWYSRSSKDFFSGKKVGTNGFETIGFDKTIVECYNCHKRCHFAREYMALRENRNREPAEDGPINFALMAYTSLGSLSSSNSDTETGVGFDSQVIDSQVNDRYKTGEWYHAIPPPYTGNLMPPKPNLILVDMDKYVVSESVTSVTAVATNKAKTSESKPKSVSEPIIEDWVSDSEDENETETKSK